MNKSSFQNELIKETSPYLLQHANNPVQWKPWTEQTLAQAKKENKLLLISIGYSACHWCHVMEKECFEDIAVAEVMNPNYINIKIDREERPDVDQIYMNALQLMTGSGGWPLNIIALPDGRPIWGGTYFSKENWIDALQKIQSLFENQPKKLLEYANKLTSGLKTMDLVSLNNQALNFSSFDLKALLVQWENQLDWEKGGSKRAPKFMMPNNLLFLMRYAYQTKKKSLLEYVNITLTQMTYGGVFDQINGGFSRYSVDEKWHIPHFEKMLYDNAQLVSVYSDAYCLTKNPLYKEVVYETLAFIKKELTNEDGGFYSALDADSLNNKGILEEGAYYVFTKKELQTILGKDFTLFAAYYNVNTYGKWEHDKYVLIRNTSDKEIIEEFQITQKDFVEKKIHWKVKLQNLRKTKSKPRLDNKILTSWNGLMLKGYVDAYRAFGDKDFLDIAIKNATFISKKQLQNNGSLLRNYNDKKSTIPAFLEDYALLAAGFISLYEVTLDEKWIQLSKKLIDFTFSRFFDTTSGMFFFTSKENKDLITRNIEYRDNVIPSSNSIQAKNLFWLGHFFGNKKYVETSRQMLKNVLPEVDAYPSGYSNWLDLLLNYSKPFYELVIVGENAILEMAKLNSHYLPNTLKAGTTKKNSSPLFMHRIVPYKTLFYICTDSHCENPLSSIEDVLLKIH
ncbi:MAG: thioredoxin domain-containing protein [Bacteroidetes bacterium HGW-Bacteroidetes-2]|jgi:hypothetical protein|nr:MAG: thioredoxin domain-containing protein [Bacteroidetes bacterium HGW-Bacteroidetes-2]